MLRQRPNSQVTIGDGSTSYMELNADTVSDLALALEGTTIAAGSVCLVIETGDFYVLDGNDNWVNQTGESNTANTLSATTINNRTERLGFDSAMDIDEVTKNVDVLGDIDGDTE